MKKLVIRSVTWLIASTIGILLGLYTWDVAVPPPIHTDSCYAIHFDDELSKFKTIEVIVIGKDEDGQETLWRYTAGRED